MANGKQTSHEKRGDTITVYFPDASEIATIKKAADAAGVNVSTLVRDAARGAALRSLARCPTCGGKIKGGSRRAA